MHELCVLSSRGLCVGLITRPEESYRMSSYSLDNDDDLARYGLLRHGGGGKIRVIYRR